MPVIHAPGQEPSRYLLKELGCTLTVFGVLGLVGWLLRLLN